MQEGPYVEYDVWDGLCFWIIITGCQLAATLQIYLKLMWGVIELGIAGLQAALAEQVDTANLQSRWQHR